MKTKYTIKDLNGELIARDVPSIEMCAKVCGVSEELIRNRLERKVIIWDTFEDEKHKFNVFIKE